MYTKLYFVVVALSILAIEDTFGKPSSLFQCPPLKPLVYCLIDPCSKSTCPQDPSAHCVTNYCGGCNAIWLTADDKPAVCDKISPCPLENQVECLVDPCRFATCLQDPSAHCVANYCGGCNAIWLTADNKPAVCDKTSQCPLENQVECLVDPCRFATCPAHPEAKCVANYCGGCNAEWFNSNNERVDCESRS